MRRYQVLAVILSVTLLTTVGHALAFGPGAAHSGQKVAQITFIDPRLSVIQLSDGMELKALDQRMLSDLKVGEWVKIDFTYSDGQHVYLNSVAPAAPDEIPASAGTSRGSSS